MSDPLDQFKTWLDDAIASGQPEPTAMALATVGTDGEPAVRMVLLKHADADGFVFYTNTHSPKGRELSRCPHAELVFYWNPPGRQVRVHGAVEAVSDAEADAYFASRPYRSRIGAWASQQSEPLANQAALVAAAARVALRHPVDVPRPPHWSGYRVVPTWIEFWEERPYRLHDRIRHQRTAEGGWTGTRLNP